MTTHLRTSPPLSATTWSITVLLVTLLGARVLPGIEGTAFGVASAAAESACDSDGDGSCDGSDPCPDDGRNDVDGDGVCEGPRFGGGKIGGNDNCPTVSNPGQQNLDGDDRGNACDACPGASGSAEDSCLGTGVWESRDSSNEPRSESGYTRAGNRFYLIGGEQTDSGTIVEVYDPSTDSWSTAPPLPNPRHHVQPVTVGSKIYLPGGLVHFPGPSVTEHLMLDTNNLGAGWQSRASMPTSRGAHGCAVEGVRIYCGGGLSSAAGDTAISTMEVYNTVDNAWKSLASMPRPRDHFDPVVIDGKLYAIGGRDTAINATYANNDIYDIRSNSWSQGAPIPTARGGYGADILEGRIVVVSGEGGGPVNGVFPQVEEYDPRRNLWRSLASVPTPRHGFGAVVGALEGDGASRLYTGAGAWKQGFAFTKTHEVFRYNTCSGASDCNDYNVCTVDSCSGSGQCQNTPVNNGTSCNDGASCTSNDQCTAGQCSGTSTCSGGAFCNPQTDQCESPALVCLRAGSDPTAKFFGDMTADASYTGGDDSDGSADSLSCPMVFADSSSSSPGGGSGDKVRYDISLPAGGQWAMWGRMYYPGNPGSNHANSFLVQMDGGPLHKFGNNKDFYQQFHYDGDGKKETGPPAPLVLDLAAGPHTFIVEKREATPVAPRLDVVCFGQDLDTAPNDFAVCNALGGCTSDCSATTTVPATTSTSTTSTTLPPTTTTTLPPSSDLHCWAAATGASPSFAGKMTTSLQYAGGADADGAADNLTTPLVFADSTGNSTGGNSGDEVAYAVDLPTAGNWYLWGRFYYPGNPGSNHANSFLASVDGGSLKKLGNKQTMFQTWHFDGDGSFETGPPLALSLGTLAAGPHVLKIEKREAAPGGPPRLDVLCLTQDPSQTPDDVAVCAAMGGCGPTPTTTLDPPDTTTTTVPDTTTTTEAEPTTTTLAPTTTTTTLPAQGLICLAAGADPTAQFSGKMTKSTELTGGSDADPFADSLAGSLVFASSVSNSPGGGSGDHVRYLVDLPTTDSWYLWGRFYYPGTPGSNHANSFLATVDGGAPKKLGNNRSYFQTWHFDGNGNMESGPTAPLSLGVLGAGVHSLEIEKREVTPGGQPRLDVLCLTTDPGDEPDDHAACAALGGCEFPTTTTIPGVSTTTSTLLLGSTTTTTLETTDDLVCLAAATDGSPIFAGDMTADAAFARGTDLDPGADSLTALLVYPDSNGNAFAGGSGDEVTYTVDLPSSGQWHLWARMYYPGAPGSNGANSFFVSVDGAGKKKVGNKSTLFRTWHFDGDGSSSIAAPAPLDLGFLAAGAHEVIVEKREALPDPPRLDVLCFTRDDSAPPTDTEACTAMGGCD